MYVGKFKSSEGSFKADLLPISPQELLALLQESECQEAMKGTVQNSGISVDDLKKLLDRSDLRAKWKSRLAGNNPGSYSVITDVPSLIVVYSYRANKQQQTFIAFHLS